MTLQFQPTRMTMLVIVPPPEICEKIDEMRSVYDKSYQKSLMPHLSIFFEFVPKNMMYQASKDLEKELVKMKPFKIQLKNFSTNDNSKYIFLEPTIIESEKKDLENYELQKLFKICVGLFPPCKDSFSGKTFSPHITIGTVDQTKKKKIMKELEDKWEPLVFAVTDLHIIARNNPEAPAEIFHYVPFGGDKKE